MIRSSKGLEGLNTGQVHYLIKYLARSFPDAEMDDLLRSIDHQDMTNYFLIKNNKPIAMVSFRKKGILTCTGTYFTNVFYNVATAPYYRRKGYMMSLLKQVIHQLRQQRRKYVYLEVLKPNMKAIRLYEKLGFHILYECMPTSLHHGIYIMRLNLR